MADNKNKILDDKMLKLVSGGSLPKGWQKIADMMAPGLLKQYGDVTWEEALEILGQHVTDPDDFEAIKEYMKKYFPDQFPQG